MASQQEIQLIISAVNKTESAFSELKQSLSSIQKNTEQSVASFGLLGNKIVQLTGAFVLFKETAQMAMNGIRSIFEAAREAVDDYQVSIVKTAALVTGMITKDARPLSARYAEAKTYAEGLAAVLEDVDKRTLLSAKDLQNITEEMTKQGVLLDINNAKQIKGFEALANALAVISAGAPNKEIQLRQEARALLQGEVNINSQLAQILQAQVGDLQAQIDLHKRQGDLLEWLGDQLQGFSAASGDIQSTWEAVSTSIDTLWRQVIRGGLGPAFREIVKMAQDLSNWAAEHKEQIQAWIVGAWESVKGIIDTVRQLFRGLSGDLSPIKELVITIAEGWRAIATVYLPSLGGLLGDIVKPLFDMLRTLGNIGRVAALIISGDFAGADRAFEDFEKSWKDWQQSSTDVVSGKILDRYMEDFGRRLVQYEKAWEPKKSAAKTITTPKTTTAPTDREKAEAQAAADAWLKSQLAAIRKREEETVAALRIEALETEKRFKAAEISEKEYMDTRRRIDEEMAQASIASIDLEMAAYQKVRSMKASTYKDNKERIKEEAEINAQLVKLETEREKKRTEAQERGIKADIEDIKYEEALAKAGRDTRIKGFEEESKLQKQLRDLKVKYGEMTESEALIEEIRDRRELLRLKKEALEADIASTSEDAQKLKLQSELAIIQKQIDADDLRMQEQRAKMMGSTVEAILLGFRDVFMQWRDISKSMYDVARETAQAMQQAFSDFFFDAFEGRMKSLADYLTGFLTSVKRALANVMGQQVTGALLSGIGSLLGIGIFSGTGGGLTSNKHTYFYMNPGVVRGSHGGGLIGYDNPSFYRLVPDIGIFAHAPRLHSGFLPDEYPAVLKRGEAVFTPGQMRALGNILSSSPNVDVNINIENKTGIDIDRKNVKVETKWAGQRMIKDILIELLNRDKTIQDALGVKPI